MPEETGKKAGKVLPALCRILGTLLILLVFAILIPLSVPRMMGLETYRVISPSMEPKIPVGSMIFVKHIEPVELQEGQVIAFYSNGSVVVHRITANNTFEGFLTTKGDANNTEDLQKVEYTYVIGTVIRHIPYFGEYAGYLTSLTGKIYMFAVMCCGVMFHILAGRLSS